MRQIQDSLSNYSVLRKRVRETLLLGQARIEQEKVRTYWQAGKYIHDHIFGNDKADYGKYVIDKLSDDLALNHRLLYYIRDFARKFPILNSRSQFTWSHYRALLNLADDKDRKMLAARAARLEWTAEKLQTIVVEINARKSQVTGRRLLTIPTLGPFWTYRVIRPETIHSKANEPLLDLGFSQRLEMDVFGSVRFSANTIVTSVKNKNGRYSLRRGEVSSPFFIGQGDPAPTDSLYTYKAYVERVIDGDTLKLEIQTGFGLRFTDKFRLKGIDCPEMDTPEGVRAKKFVESELASSEFVTVKSSVSARKEKWGRWLVDIFYSKAGNGGDRSLHYLNEMLLDKGHAVLVRAW